MKLLASLLLLAWSCCARIPENQTTVGFLNWRYWVDHDESAKLYFLTGYAEAFLNAGKQQLPDPLLTFPKAIPYGDVSTGLDQFYAAPENRVLPIGEAIWFFTKKVNGEDPARLASMLAAAIRHYRQLAEGTQDATAPTGITVPPKP